MVYVAKLKLLQN